MLVFSYFTKNSYVCAFELDAKVRKKNGLCKFYPLLCAL